MITTLVGTLGRVKVETDLIQRIKRQATSGPVKSSARVLGLMVHWGLLTISKRQRRGGARELVRKDGMSNQEIVDAYVVLAASIVDRPTNARGFVAAGDSLTAGTSSFPGSWRG